MTPTTRLFNAAKAGRLLDMLAALTDGANINAKDRNTGNTALHYAAEHGHLDLIRALLARDADVNACDTWRRRPLHLASSNGHVAIVHELIEKGATLNHTDDLRFTPLRYAELHHRDKVITVLQEALRKQGATCSPRNQRNDNPSLRDR